MNTKTITEVLDILTEAARSWRDPVVSEMAARPKDPFKVLISTILSLRTKDATTAEASRRLYEVADTPESIEVLPEERIAELIYPVGFYRTKAASLKKVCRIIVDDFESRVPDDMDLLLSLPGVGRKTANLVLTVGYGKPGICVDTHVHRISNRFGYVTTKNPHETEFALRDKLPREYWIPYNDLLVTLGQNVCSPISPRCSECPVEGFCEKKGVLKSR